MSNYIWEYFIIFCFLVVFIGGIILGYHWDKYTGTAYLIEDNAVYISCSDVKYKCMDGMADKRVLGNKYTYLHECCEVIK